MMMMKMLKMMKTNVLLEMRHLCSIRLLMHSRPHNVGTIQKIVFFWGCFRMFVMGVIDYRDGSTLRSATVVYILRVQTSLSYNVCNYVVQMT